MGLPAPSQPRIPVTGKQVRRWEVRTFHQCTQKGKSIAIVTVGIDLAKNVLAVHGVGAAGKPALLSPSVAYSKLAKLIASLPPRLVGIGCCIRMT
jgi:hypothetical protein